MDWTSFFNDVQGSGAGLWVGGNIIKVSLFIIIQWIGKIIG